MSKRDIVIAIIGIIVTAGAFFGGIAYQYEDYVPIVEYAEDQPIDQIKYYYEFIMPIDCETASKWLDWAANYHLVFIDYEIFTEDMPLELHQAYLVMYVDIKDMFLELEKEWGGVNE